MAAQPDSRGGFGAGLYDSTLGPLAQMARHPLGTLTGMGRSLAHPLNTAAAVAKAAKQTGQEALAGNPYALGMAIGTVGSMAIPSAGEAEAVEDAARVGKLGGGGCRGRKKHRGRAGGSGCKQGGRSRDRYSASNRPCRNKSGNQLRSRPTDSPDEIFARASA